ncbi:hypothetical protein [Burkholderia sp. AU6039]|uniref:hypothetical protein n=1 Tax=Burkholderia sp. AU6039 TaxID=2015344 RepID=UPI000B7A55C4|nr:hypothetical protein [Burkholderia sp. AU6039]OXJ20271.1 hypothetical protein CFB39_10045 [Burkholderia sp. AU6039]
MDLSKYPKDVVDRAITEANSLLIDAILKRISENRPEVVRLVADEALSNVAQATSFEGETSVEDLTKIVIEGRAQMLIDELTPKSSLGGGFPSTVKP